MDDLKMQGQTLAERAQSVGYPIPVDPQWPFPYFSAVSSADGVTFEGAGIPGMNETGGFLKCQYDPTEKSATFEQVVAAGKRAIVFWLGHLAKHGSLQDFRPHKLLVLVGCAPATPSLGEISNELSTFLLELFGIDLSDPNVDKGVRATVGVNMDFAVEVILTMKRLQLK